MTAGSEPNFAGTRRILVTGAGGFIGSAIVDTLVRHGFTARALVRKTGSRIFLPPQAEIAVGDVTLIETLKPALDGVAGVIHCAGATRAFSLDDYRRVNRDGTRHLLAACASLQKLPERIVCLGSLAAFGPALGNRPVVEDDEPHPVSNYGISKLEGHRVAEGFMKVLPIANLIPPAVYGPRDRDIFAYFRLAKTGILPFLGSRTRRLSAVHVQDVSDAALLCLTRPEAVGRSYFVSDGAIHSWEDFAGAICAAMGKRPLRVTIPSWAARWIALAGDAAAKFTGRPPLLGRQKMHELLQPAWTCSSERISRELGFAPSYPLREGIEDTYLWYLDHNWLRK
jgi:dihydroflavonol-4-reductase